MSEESPKPVLYLRTPGHRIPADSLTADWGAFIRYLEVGDDQHVIRQVDQYDNGTLLRYDRSHWCDDFGMLLCGRFSRKQKAARLGAVITAAEFERVWRKALGSPFREEQVRHSRQAVWGQSPRFIGE